MRRYITSIGFVRPVTWSIVTKGELHMSEISTLTCDMLTYDRYQMERNERKKTREEFVVAIFFSLSCTALYAVYSVFRRMQFEFLREISGQGQNSL